MDTQTQELPQSDELTQTQELAVEQAPQSAQEASPEVSEVSEPKTPKPRFRKTLSFHLLLLFIALSTCVILVLDVAFTAFSYRSAIDDVDQSLIDTADNVRDRYILHAITTADPSAEQYALFSEPDHYIHIHFLTDPFASSSEDNADAAAEAPQEADATSVNTFGTDFVATPAAYTVSAKRSYMLGLPYADNDDDDDDDNDDDDDDDDNDKDDDDDDYVPPKNTGGTKSNTGTSNNKSNTNTGTSGNKSNTSTGGNKANTNTGTSGNKANTNTGTSGNKVNTNTGANKSGTSGSKSVINSGTSRSGVSGSNSGTSRLGTSSNKSGTNGSKSGAGNVNINEIENYVPAGEDPSIYKPPSNSIILEEGYFIYNQPPDQSVVDQYGLPKDIEDIELSLGEKPQTVEGTSGSQWRAVSVPIRDNKDETIGYVVLARPLEPVIDSVRQTSLYLGLFGLGIVALGSLLAYYLIRRSLRSLNSISESTHAIAAGDLTQRVPSGPKGSEVGMLSDSINVMLSQIERSFDVKEQSEAKMRQFVSDASHELRTPLTTVRGYAELFRMGGVPTGEMEHTMGRIESEAKRMGVLVEDLLQLARLDEARPMNFQTLNASDIAETVLSDFQVRDPEREVRLVGLDGGAVTPTLIDGDKDKIEQVITNLLSNVQTHTPAGTPVELAVGTAYAPSVGPDGLPSEQVLIEVRDHGAGVPEAEREKIFERFFRTDSSRSRDSGGSGLGLSIVSSVMQAHGGYAQALETDGGGLTIRLAFPTAPVPAAPVAA